MKKKSFLLGAFILSSGGVISKLLGAVYRIPLMNIVGATVFGKYQLVFPIYALMFTISSTGIPVAVCKLMSENLAVNDNLKAKQIFKSSVVLSVCAGVIGAVLLCLLSGVLARLQNDSSIYSGYLILAPALLFVCVISCIRGYFQGLNNMLPTATSQVVEQVIKLIVGLGTAYYFVSSPQKAFNAIVFAVTASEVVAMLYMLAYYYFARDPRLKNCRAKGHCYKKVLAFSLPVTIGVCLIPLSQFIDSIIIVRLLSYANNATELYGYFSGCINSFNSMPIALAGGIAVAVIPAISASFIKGDKTAVQKKMNQALGLTVFVGLPCTVGVFMLANNIASVLYYSLSSSEIAVIGNMLRWGSFSIIAMCVMQTTVSILQSLGKIYIPFISLLVGIILKVVCNIALVSQPHVNIFGAIFAQEICYFVAFIINLIYIIKYAKPSFNWKNIVLKPCISTVIMAVTLLLIGGLNLGGGLLKLGVSVMAGMVAYFLLYMAERVMSRKKTT